MSEQGYFLPIFTVTSSGHAGCVVVKREVWTDGCWHNLPALITMLETVGIRLVQPVDAITFSDKSPDSITPDEAKFATAKWRKEFGYAD